MQFFQRIEEASHKNGSLLCIGLDPELNRLPSWCHESKDPVLAFNRHIIDLTSDLVCAYKPNAAFYEALGGHGWSTLCDTILYAKERGVPVILDAKRADIGVTSRQYAEAAFKALQADAITVNPYMGWDSIEPFVRYADRGVFVLCLTSNPGAQDFQMLDGNGHVVFEHVARQCAGWNERGNIGLVAGATYPDELITVRQFAPNEWILLPGVGAQGANLPQALHNALKPDGSGVIVNASRTVIWADDPREAAQQLRDQIEDVRRQKRETTQHQALHISRTSSDPRKVRLALALHDIGAIQFGSFTLQSGVQSPVYVDLRLLVSNPHVLALAARLYSDILDDLAFDRLAAIPYAGLPLGTAVALHTSTALIYPRKETKTYGTGRQIEGHYQPGETIAVLDDLISSGNSKIKAIEPLRQAGLQVHDIVVLIDRESGGREELAAQGVNVHSVFSLRDLLDVLHDHERINSDQRTAVDTFLEEQLAS